MFLSGARAGSPNLKGPHRRSGIHGSLGSAYHRERGGNATHMPTFPATPLETIELQNGDARALLAPERGGMVTRWLVGGDSILYLDEASLVDRAKNVRGGCPVLFPSPGKLDTDCYARGGAAGSMGQHGFARNLPWDVVEVAPSHVTLRLVSSDATRAMFPWDFALTYRYVLGATALRIEQRFEARGPRAMPFGAGFHPYFRVESAQKAAARVPTAATRAWDNAKKEQVGLTGPIDLTRDEVDLHLLDHGASSATLERGDGHRVELRASPELRRWVVWTLAGRAFVCLEPWTCPANALNTGEGLLVATPGTPVELALEMTFV